MIVASAFSIRCLGHRRSAMNAKCFMLVKVLCYSSDRLQTTVRCSCSMVAACHMSVDNFGTKAFLVKK